MKESIKENGPKLAVIVAMVMYLVACPYTKVEESFNIQAIHDILYHSRNYTKYDHLEFPGVVPRTFIGPLFVSALSLPSVSILSILGFEKTLMQYLVRLWIGCSTFYGLCKFTASLQKIFGTDVRQHFILITASQFHFLFYISRPLPNTFAHILAFPALAAWMAQDFKKFMWFSAFAILVFRFELSLLMGVCLLISLLQRNLSLKVVVKTTIPAGFCALICTVIIDSFFWKRLLWPEGEVAWFNIVLNKSGEWGTQPFFWYFTSVLPRVILTSSAFIPWGLYCDPHRCLQIFIPALSFILAFSCLPHKELRFIFYTFPLFNVIIARAYADLYHRHRKGLKWKLLYVFSYLCLLVNFAFSFLFFYASYNNYPGGEIMYQLHGKISCESPVHVHINNLAAQTGVTRFTEICSDWRYNKTEHLSDEILRSDPSITHVIREYFRDDEARRLWEESHVEIAVTSSFSGFFIARDRSFYNIPMLTMRTSPALVLWQRKTFK